MELKVLLLFLWSCSGPVQASVIRRYFWYKPHPRTWEDAQRFCRRRYGRDLATVVNDTDLNDTPLKKFHAWFGLKKQNGHWQWYNGTDVSPPDRFRSRFASGEAEHKEACGKVLSYSNKVHAVKCEEKHFIFCEGSGSDYRFIPETMKWAEGKQYCSEKRLRYMAWDLGQKPFNEPRDFPVWIGLKHNGDDWRWSDGTHSDYRKWASGSGSGSGFCVAVSSKSKEMLNQTCSKAFPSLCYRHNVLLLKEELSWEDARETCGNLRNYYNHTSFSLLSVEKSELEYVQSHAKGANTTKVWVGLRFLAGSWFWSNGVPVSLSLPSCPKFHCGALVVNTSSIEPTDCSEKLNLLCYGSKPNWK